LRAGIYTQDALNIISCVSLERTCEYVPIYPRDVFYRNDFYLKDKLFFYL
jgi:hypothetical protein